jgi:predicted RNase H-like HicB family nuclease
MELSEKYPITVGWSEEDQTFVAKAPAWPSLGTNGDTAMDAVKEMQQLIHVCMEDMLETGESPPAFDAAEMGRVGLATYPPEVK